MPLQCGCTYAEGLGDFPHGQALLMKVTKPFGIDPRPRTPDSNPATPGRCQTRANPLLQDTSFELPHRRHDVEEERPQVVTAGIQAVSITVRPDAFLNAALSAPG
jgi:hypothetical protein